MDHNDLNILKNWFLEYCRSFYSSNEEDQKNISLKVQHTLNVCENIVQIARERLLSENEIALAETIAIFHDIGRFPQYAQYKTFRDSISVNHGKLGSEILVKEKILQDIPENEQGLIVCVVKFHNAFRIPDLKSPEAEFFLKLIRDADKLDIWRLFAEYYESSEDERASAVNLGLPDLPGYSEEILSYLYNKQVVSLASLKTLNDFKIMQLSWIYDLNFKTSFRLLVEGGYLNRIALTLPQTDEIIRALLILQEFTSQSL